MTIFHNDTFTVGTQTPVTSHTSDSGHTWVGWAGTLTPPANVFPTLGGVVGAGATNPSVWRPSIIAPTADVVVTQSWRIDNPTPYSTFGPAARLNTAGTAGYVALYNRASQVWSIDRIDGALARTNLGNSATRTYASGNIRVFELTVTGSGATVTLVLKEDGVTILTATDTSASRITAAGYTGFWIHASVAQGCFLNSTTSDDLASAGATAVTMTGPTSGAVGVASTNFTIGANGTITGTRVVTPSDGGGGGTFTPSTVSISAATPTATFTYTPASAGAKTISVTNDGGLTNPANITYTASVPAPVLTLPTGTNTGPFSGTGTVTTNTANGTLYYITTTSPTALLAAVKAGNSQPVTASGLQNITITGLAASTGYYNHFVHTNSSGVDSAVSSSAQWSTAADTPPVGVIDLSNPITHVLKNNAGMPFTSVAYRCTIIVASTGALVGVKTGTTTAGALIGVLTDAALVLGTDYFVIVEPGAGGAYGVFRVTAT